MLIMFASNGCNPTAAPVPIILEREVPEDPEWRDGWGSFRYFYHSTVGHKRIDGNEV
ncbi:hypothetical protein SISNIDRAFT_452474 [Sistotremastrum niveocremeum HHB9708]|uniref:Uncharacterized protein n=2 Tax=Sistotremastraceae TaxID=3402574 RepID=A0A164WLL2_9AGAM|nr:hypothetical protein SISNIDRAFT_452474 [Sistotremastrum niveocremeum HHB9708]KZT40947.1 hypothetical protein SISSUDRAFT_1043457 [Sistotremastrum suecicum HHB10207 ss-3]